MAIIKIDAVSLATELADERVSFKTQNKIFKEIGQSYTKDDLRTTEEWVSHYEYYFKMISNSMIEDGS